MIFYVTKISVIRLTYITQTLSLMKKIIPFIAIVFLLSSCKTSESSFTHFYKNHKDESVFSMKIPAFIANMFIKNEDLKELKPLFRKAKSYRIMVFENHSQELQDNFQQFIKKHHYKPLMLVKDHKDKVGIYVLERKNRIRELVMNVKGDDDLVMMSVKTNLTYDEISKIANSISRQ